MFSQVHVIFGYVYYFDGIIEDVDRKAMQKLFGISKSSRVNLFFFPCCSDLEGKLCLIGISIKAIDRITAEEYCADCRDSLVLCKDCLNRIHVDLDLDRYFQLNDFSTNQIEVETVLHSLVQVIPPPEISSHNEQLLAAFTAHFPSFVDQTPQCYFLLNDCLYCT